MQLRVLGRVVVPSVSTTLALLFWAAPASAQGRGMMPMQPTSPMMTTLGGTAMMRAPMSNSQAVLLLAALRQREVLLQAATRRIEFEMAALEMRPASATRDARLITAQQRQLALTMALRQVAQQIAALQG